MSSLENPINVEMESRSRGIDCAKFINLSNTYSGQNLHPLTTLISSPISETQ